VASGPPSAKFPPCSNRYLRNWSTGTKSQVRNSLVLFTCQNQIASHVTIVIFFKTSQKLNLLQKQIKRSSKFSRIIAHSKQTAPPNFDISPVVLLLHATHCFRKIMVSNMFVFRFVIFELLTHIMTM